MPKLPHIARNLSHLTPINTIRARCGRFTVTRSLSSPAAAPDFDSVLPRADNFAMKQMKYARDNATSEWKNPKVIPMWVADTDFRSPEPVRRRLAEYVTGHGVLGYTDPDQMKPLEQAIVSWVGRRYHWTIDPEWIVHLPGVVPGFNLALRAMKTNKEEKCLVQAPNYPPMLAAAGRNNGFSMQTVRTALSQTSSGGRRWTLDWNQLDKLASDPKSRVFLSCNPANPTGSVLPRSEMDELASIAQRHDLFVISDEIWADLILSPDTPHIPAGSIPGLRDRSVTIMAPSKTFNIAGLCSAFAIIPNHDLRARFKRERKGLVPSPGVLGSLATIECFSGSCDPWLASQLSYLRTNRDIFCGSVQKQLNGLIDVVVPDATFLAWLDCTRLAEREGLKGAVQKWFEDAGLGPSPGVDFGGSEYKHFARINFGAPRSVVESALQRLVRAAGRG